GGSVPTSPVSGGTYIPGASVPVDTSSGGHYIPGGNVQITPKLGIDPNTPSAQVHPSAAGRVFPPKVTEWHGPRFMHAQNWPSDKYHHIVETRAWEPKDTHSTWEPPKGFDFVMSTDLIDAGAMIDLLDTKLARGADQSPKVENTFNDFSQPSTHQSVNITNFVDASSVSYSDQHLPTYIFEDNRSNVYVLAAPERGNGALLGLSG
ncbi:MAG: hypothetical protein V3573_02025, partial [Desulfovibrionaceae bacterium]